MNIDSVLIRHSPIILIYRMLLITIGIGFLYVIYGIVRQGIGDLFLIENTIHPILLLYYHWLGAYHCDLYILKMGIFERYRIDV